MADIFHDPIELLIFWSVVAYLTVVGFECAWRYLAWYRQVWHSNDQLLRELLLGTSLRNASTSIFTLWIFVAIFAGEMPLWLRISLDIVLAAGTTLNLVSYWRLNDGDCRRDMVIAIACRSAIAITAAAVFAISF